MATTGGPGSLGYIDELASEAVEALAKSPDFDPRVQYVLDVMRNRKGEIWYVWNPLSCFHRCERWT